MFQKEDNDWVKKCIEYEVEGTRPRGRPKKTWRVIVEKDCEARVLNREDAMDCSRWRKQMGIIDDHGHKSQERRWDRRTIQLPPEFGMRGTFVVFENFKHQIACVALQ